MNERLKHFLRGFLGWFLIFYLALSLVYYFRADTDQNKDVSEEISVTLQDRTLTVGNLARFVIENKHHMPVQFQSPCESETPTLSVYRLVNNTSVAISDFTECNGKRVKGFSLEPGETMNFHMAGFNQALFSEEGEYQIEMRFGLDEEETKTVLSQRFEYDQPGMFRLLFRAIVSKPLFNILVFFVDRLPGHSFGWAVVLLTLVVRFLLLGPNKKAIRSQHELQKFQPKLEELRKKYAKNQQMLAMKTMELYKTHKINPMSSCWPVLLQMPFLIGLYYIVRDGLSPHLSYLLYSFQTGVDLSVVDTQFFSLDLAKRNTLELPILVGIAQWIAMHITIAKQKKKNAGKKSENQMAAQMEQATGMMKWVMPLMIGFFTASLPAAVGMYWLTSTVFGIAQQKYVYWQLDRPGVVRKKEDS